MQASFSGVQLECFDLLSDQTESAQNEISKLEGTQYGIVSKLHIRRKTSVLQIFLVIETSIMGNVMSTYSIR